MPKCINCSKKGWFLEVSNDGFCRQCFDEVRPVIESLCRSVISNSKAGDRSTVTKARLTKYFLAEDAANRLIEFDKKGVPTLTTPPSEVAQSIRTIAQSLIATEIDDCIYQAKQATIDGSTDTQKLSGFSKSIKRLDALMEFTDDVTELEIAIQNLRCARDNFSAKLKIENADLLCAQGKERRAKDLLIEALHTMERDGTPDEDQLHLIQDVEKRLEQLQD